MTSFGKVIPVTTLNKGFLGGGSRMEKRTIVARPVAGPNPINFGDSLVVVADSGIGQWQTVKDFITGGGTMTAALFAGFAWREVKTNLQYSALTTIGTDVIGQYAVGEIAEGLMQGSQTIQCNVGTPQVEGAVYLRIALNGAIPAGIVGGIEAAADGSNTVKLTNVLFKESGVDANGVCEITILNRLMA